MFQLNCYSARVSFVDTVYKADFYRPNELIPFFIHAGLVLHDTVDSKSINESVNVMDELGVLVGIFSFVVDYSTANGLTCGSSFSPHYDHIPDNTVYQSSAVIVDQTAVDTFYTNADLHISVDFRDDPSRQSSFLPPLLVSYSTGSVIVANYNDSAEVFFTFPMDYQYMINLFNNDENVSRTINIKGYPFTFYMDYSILSIDGFNNGVMTYPNVVNLDTHSFSSLFGGSGGGFDFGVLQGLLVGIQNSVSTSNVDLTPIVSALNSQTALINGINFDLTPVINLLTPLQTAELNNLHEDIVTLGSQLQTVTVPLQSLNGNGSEYMDNAMVTVYGRDTVYSVARSYMSMTDNNAYTAVYDLVSTTGAKLTVPESLLSLYVAPVVIP